MTKQILPFIFLIVLAACNSEQRKSLVENSETKDSSQEPVTKRFKVFEQKDFSFQYPVDWTIDTVPPPPSIFTASRTEPPLTFQVIVLVDKKNMTLKDFAQEYVQEKTNTEVNSRGFVQTIQTSPYPIVNGLKRLTADGASASFYFYKISKTDVLCLLFMGHISAFSHYKEEIDKITHSTILVAK